MYPEGIHVGIHDPDHSCAVAGRVYLLQVLVNRSHIAKDGGGIRTPGLVL